MNTAFEEKISVIVPVYNVEKYLSRCIDSILAQTYTNLEIFLVDDGSTDSCGKICDEYKEKDERVIVIHKENGGLSDARNAALKKMIGKYVTLIDSDDFVSPYYIYNLYEALKATGAGMSASWFVEYFDDDKLPDFSKVKLENIKSYGIQDCLEKMLYQDGFETCAWGKLYKAELFDGIEYPKGKLYEDIPVTYRLIERSGLVAVITNIDYMYYQRSSSIANEKFNIRKLDAIEHMGALHDYVCANYPEIKKAADCRYLSTICNILFQIPNNEYKAERKMLWGRIKELRHNVVIDKKARKKNRYGAALSYLGCSVMSLIYRFL